MRKRLFIISGILISIPVLVIVFISPITKYLVEKYSVKYTGRQIKMDWAYVNPFTGYIHFNNLKIYEEKSDTLFISAKGLSVSISLCKILSKEYEITSVTLDRPIGRAIQKTKSVFNFSDIIYRFSSHSPDTNKVPTSPVHFSILNIKINDGVFYLYDTVIHVNYFIRHFNFEGSGDNWRTDTFPGAFSFAPGIGTGFVKGNFTINKRNSDYRFYVVTQKLNLSIIDQYLKDMINYGTFSAYLDADIKTTGNFKDAESSDVKGRLAISDFHFGKNPNDDYFSFDKFVLAVDEINPKSHLYHLDSLVLTHPYFKYEEYDYLDNIQTMFGKNGTNVLAENADKKRFNLIIELGRYLINLSKNFFQSEYKINNLALTRGDIQFNDYSKSEKFSIEANPLYIVSDSINKGKGRVHVSVKSGIKPYGKMTIDASINPRDSADFDVDSHLTGIPITLFNPYVISCTSYPFNRGTIEFSGSWKVRKGVIQSQNHLLIIDPRITKRIKNKDNSWIPMWLVMYLVRRSDNAIDYSIPITGNLKNPKFHLHDVVFSTLKNIFVKPAATPYRVEVRAQESKIEKSLTLKWGMRESSIQSKEEKFLKKLAKFLEETPTASIIVSPQQYVIKEEEYILFFEAKKKYYLSLNRKETGSFSEEDSEYVDKMSVKDSLFIRYLNKHLTHSLVFTIQGKCSNLISQAIINGKYNQLEKARANTFNSYFKEKGLDKQVIFKPAQNTIPYNGFSFYSIAYKGELPDYLIKAYSKMEGLNNKTPREKYKEDRGKIKSM